MIKADLFIAGKLMSGGEELIELWRREPDSIIWLDLFEIEAVTEEKLLRSEFRIHPLAIQDAQRDRHPPKIESFDNYTFILLRGLSADSKEIDFKTIQLALFIGKNFLITRHSGQSLSINRLHEIVEQDLESYCSGSKLALKLCRLVALRFLDVLLQLESRLEELEMLIVEKPDDSMLAELIQYKSDLNRMHRFATYHEQLFRLLKDRDFSGFTEKTRHEIIDVWEQQERTQSLSQLYYETASDLIDGYISVASHRLNKIMKVLTIVMAVFVPLSFLAGIYGMNFENMPELHSKSGYFILLSIMAAIATLLLIIFRRIKWL